jgi:hypothetical protein
MSIAGFELKSERRYFYLIWGIALASAIAQEDPARAVTHNKGILNGVLAVTQATANDTRAVAMAAASRAQPTPTETARPNFVFFLIDDMGWMDTSCYGSTFYETPNIDQLASQGVRFTNAYAAGPVPDRCSGGAPALRNIEYCATSSALVRSITPSTTTAAGSSAARRHNSSIRSKTTFGSVRVLASSVIRRFFLSPM